MTADEIIQQLQLVPHPEGGFFAETFRSPCEVASGRHDGPRRASTAIYFLLRSQDFSAFHRVRSDEVWHHYLGDPLALSLIDPNGSAQLVRLGPDLARGERPQHVVAAGVYQAARAMPGARGYTLCGCTVAPGFEFRDFEMPPRAELLRSFPQHRGLIEALTR